MERGAPQFIIIFYKKKGVEFCRMKKIIAFLLASLLLFTFSGCSQKENKEEETSGGNNNTIEVSNTDEKEDEEDTDIKVKEIDFSKLSVQTLKINDSYDEVISYALPEECKDDFFVEETRTADEVKFSFLYGDTNYPILTITATQNMEDEGTVGRIGRHSISYEVGKSANPTSYDGVQINYILENISKITDTIHIKQITTDEETASTPEENIKPDKITGEKPQTNPIKKPNPDDIIEKPQEYGFTRIETKSDGTVVGYKTNENGEEETFIIKKKPSIGQVN